MPNIIVCDDEMPIRDWMKIILSRIVPDQTNILTAENGQKAWELYLEKGAQIVFTDIKMPVMDGFELTRRIRSVSDDTHIVILTSYNDFEYARTAFASRANDYILKTEINQDRLAALLKDHISRGEGNSGMRLAAAGEYLDALGRFMADPRAVENQYSFSVPEGAYFCLAMCTGDSEIPSIASFPGIHTLFDTFTEEHIYLGCFVSDQIPSDRFSLKINLNGFVRRLGEINYNCRIAAGEVSENPEDMPGSFSGLLKKIQPAPEVETTSGLLSPDLPEPSEISPIIRESLTYISEHFASISGLPELASAGGVTPEHFSRLFKKEIGIPFNIYLNKYRLNEAKRLLTETDTPLSEIYKLCGFSSQSYFSKKFKEEFEHQPSYFRMTR